MDRGRRAREKPVVGCIVQPEHGLRGPIDLQRRPDDHTSPAADGQRVEDCFRQPVALPRDGAAETHTHGRRTGVQVTRELPRSLPVRRTLREPVARHGCAAAPVVRTWDNLRLKAYRIGDGRSL